MVRIVFEQADGEQMAVNAAAGESVMQAARNNGVPGIDADCGGCMACGTCHVVVDPKWNDLLPAQTEAEVEMLDYVPDPQPNARLSCQIPVTAALEGIVLRIPPHQR